jgi:AcrR family transcriptional regulator
MAQETAAQGARALHWQETHERVFRAAVRVITARGYDGATMEEIATEAGVARRTAFNHFAAKSDIATEWAVRRGREALEAVSQTSSPATGPDRVRAYFRELAQMTERDWEQTRQMTTGWLRGYGTPAHRSPLRGELHEWLGAWLRGQTSDQIPDEARDPALVIEVLYDVFRGALMRWLPEEFRPGRFSAEADAAVLLVLAGLGYKPPP